MQKPALTERLPRIDAIDIARGMALIAMAIYHFGWDLEYFGYATPGMTEHGGWRIFARIIASSFLVLVGVSLVLANGNGIRWRSFWKRLAMVVAGALAITIVTWFAMREEFIYFGILHEIALASLIGLLFLRLPALLTALIGIGVIALPVFYTSEWFDNPVGWVLGLSPYVPRSNDYVPLFPWFGPVLLGIAGTRLAASLGWLRRLATLDAGRLATPLRFSGRHSLAFYLLHQPVLFGSVWVVAQFFPTPQATPQMRFTQACHVECMKSRDGAFCARYCSCMLDELTKRKKLSDLFSQTQNDATRQLLGGLAEQCTEATDNGLLFDKNAAPSENGQKSSKPGE